MAQKLPQLVAACRVANQFTHRFEAGFNGLALEQGLLDPAL
jgi:hypothetical protein